MYDGMRPQTPKEEYLPRRRIIYLTIALTTENLFHKIYNFASHFIRSRRALLCVTHKLAFKNNLFSVVYFFLTIKDDWSSSFFKSLTDLKKKCGSIWFDLS